MEQKKPTFKNFIIRISEAPDRQAAINEIFYGTEGINMAYQRGHISYKDLELLLKLIEKMA